MKATTERSQLRQLSDADLAAEWEGGRRELFNLRMRLATRQLPQHQELRRVHKRMARILTIMGERQRAPAAEGQQP